MQYGTVVAVIDVQRLLENYNKRLTVERLRGNLIRMFKRFDPNLLPLIDEIAERLQVAGVHRHDLV